MNENPRRVLKDGTLQEYRDGRWWQVQQLSYAGPDVEARKARVSSKSSRKRRLRRPNTKKRT